MARITHHGISILLGRPMLASDQHDEDDLDREQDVHDPHGDFIIELLHALRSGDKDAVDGVAALARAFAGMVDAQRRGDQERVRQAAEDAAHALDQVLGTGGGGDSEDHDG